MHKKEDIGVSISKIGPFANDVEWLFYPTTLTRLCPRCGIITHLQFKDIYCLQKKFAPLNVKAQTFWPNWFLKTHQLYYCIL